MEHHTDIHDETRDQLTLLALDALDETVSQEWDTHVVVCQACQKELILIQYTSALLAYSAPTVTPPPHLKARLMARCAS